MAGLYPCPVCHRRFTMQEINFHTEGCLLQSESRLQVSSNNNNNITNTHTSNSHDAALGRTTGIGFVSHSLSLPKKPTSSHSVSNNSNSTVTVSNKGGKPTGKRSIPPHQHAPQHPSTHSGTGKRHLPNPTTGIDTDTTNSFDRSDVILVDENDDANHHTLLSYIDVAGILPWNEAWKASSMFDVLLQNIVRTEHCSSGRHDKGMLEVYIKNVSGAECPPILDAHEIHSLAQDAAIPCRSKAAPNNAVGVSLGFDPNKRPQSHAWHHYSVNLMPTCKNYIDTTNHSLGRMLSQRQIFEIAAPLLAPLLRRPELFADGDVSGGRKRKLAVDFDLEDVLPQSSYFVKNSKTGTVDDMYYRFWEGDNKAIAAVLGNLTTLDQQNYKWLTTRWCDHTLNKRASTVSESLASVEGVSPVTVQAIASFTELRASNYVDDEVEVIYGAASLLMDVHATFGDLFAPDVLHLEPVLSHLNYNLTAATDLTKAPLSHPMPPITAANRDTTSKYVPNVPTVDKNKSSRMGPHLEDEVIEILSPASYSHRPSNGIVPSFVGASADNTSVQSPQFEPLAEITLQFDIGSSPVLPKRPSQPSQQSQQSRVNKALDNPIPTQPVPPISLGRVQVIGANGCTVRDAVDIDHSNVIGKQVVEFDRVVELHPAPDDLETITVKRLRVRFSVEGEATQGVGWVSLTGRLVDDNLPMLSVLSDPMHWLSPVVDVPPGLLTSAVAGKSVVATAAAGHALPSRLQGWSAANPSPMVSHHSQYIPQQQPQGAVAAYPVGDHHPPPYHAQHNTADANVHIQQAPRFVDVPRVFPPYHAYTATSNAATAAGQNSVNHTKHTRTVDNYVNAPVPPQSRTAPQKLHECPICGLRYSPDTTAAQRNQHLIDCSGGGFLE